jgi:hypothetical protein
MHFYCRYLSFFTTIEFDQRDDAFNYFSDLLISQMNYVLFLVADTFRTNDLLLLRHIVENNISFCILRSKCDNDLQMKFNELQENNTVVADELEIMKQEFKAKIRKECKRDKSFCVQCSRN